MQERCCWEGGALLCLQELQLQHPAGGHPNCIPLPQSCGSQCMFCTLPRSLGAYHVPHSTHNVKLNASMPNCEPRADHDADLVMSMCG
jgi:hypothetical protein